MIDAPEACPAWERAYMNEWTCYENGCIFYPFKSFHMRPVTTRHGPETKNTGSYSERQPIYRQATSWQQHWAAAKLWCTLKSAAAKTHAQDRSVQELSSRRLHTTLLSQGSSSGTPEHTNCQREAISRALAHRLTF